MSLERAVLCCLWIIAAAATVWLVPRSEWRKFVFMCFVCQSMTWLKVALHVKLHMLEFPIREFPRATDMIFTPQYVFYPVMSGIYLMYAGHKTRLGRLTYLLCWSLSLSLLHLGLATYTQLIDYIRYHWLVGWLEFTIILATAHVIVQWYFKKPVAFKKERARHESRV